MINSPSLNANITFAILQNIWLEGFVNTLLSESGNPVLFSTIEEALSDLQEDYDIWVEQKISGERDSVDTFDVEDFIVSCPATGDTCDFHLAHGVIFLVSSCGRVITAGEFTRVNQTGLF